MSEFNKVTCLFVLKGSALNRKMNTGYENLAWGLAEKGINIHILSGGKAPESHDYKFPSNVNYHFIEKTPDNPLNFLPLFNDIVSKNNINMVVGWIVNIAPLAMANKMSGIDFIASQGQMPPRSILLRFIKNSLLGKMSLIEAFKVVSNIYRFIKVCKKMIANSVAVKNAWVKNYHLNSDICHVITRGIDTDVYQFKRKNRSDRLKLLFVGNVHKPKGLDDLVAAMEFVSYPVTITLCGKGEKSYIDYLDDKLVSYKFGHELVYAGTKLTNDLVSYYQDCDIFVFPSYSEGMPKVLLEAMSCGCPVVCSNIEPHLEVIQDGINGIIVPVKSPRHLAMGIVRYIEDPYFAEACGLNARRTIEQRFSKGHEISSWLEILG